MNTRNERSAPVNQVDDDDDDRDPRFSGVGENYESPARRVTCRVKSDGNYWPGERWNEVHPARRRHRLHRHHHHSRRRQRSVQVLNLAMIILPRDLLGIRRAIGISRDITAHNHIRVVRDGMTRRSAHRLEGEMTDPRTDLLDEGFHCRRVLRVLWYFADLNKPNDVRGFAIAGFATVIVCAVETAPVRSMWKAHQEAFLPCPTPSRVGSVVKVYDEPFCRCLCIFVVDRVLFDRFEPIKVAEDVDSDSSTFFLINGCVCTRTRFSLSLVCARALAFALSFFFASIVDTHAHVRTELSNYQRPWW